MGHFHPENEITNAFLESLDIGTDDQWIMERVGIRSRRTALPLDYIRATRNKDPRAGIEAADYSNAELGSHAAVMAMERAGVTSREIGMVLTGGCAPDYAIPAEACRIAELLGIEAPGLDLNSACTSYFASLRMLSMMDPAKTPRFILVVASEVMTRTVDYTDRNSAVLWGDGAAASVLSLSEPGRAEILGNDLTSNPSGWDKVVIPRLGHFDQQGRTVQMFAIRKTVNGLDTLRREFERPDRRFNFIGHQANLRMLENVCRRSGVPDDRHHFNVDRFGNTGAASGASVMSGLWDEWTADDDIAAVGVGSGLTWGRYFVRFRTDGTKGTGGSQGSGGSREEA